MPTTTKHQKKLREEATSLVAERNGFKTFSYNKLQQDHKKKQRREIEIREATEGSRKEDQVEKLLLLLLPHMNRHIHKRVGLRGGNGVRQKMRRRRNAGKSDQHGGV